MKKKWFWGIFITILISWIVNIIYFEMHQLKEPVVLNAYIDIPTSENTNFSLFYLTNSSEVNELESLIAGGYTFSNEQNFFPWFGDLTAQSYRQQFTHQYLKQANFIIDEQSMEQVVNGVKNNELYARFTNGQVVPIELEKLDFRTTASESNIFTNEGYFVGNDGIQGTILEATETVRMDAISLPEAIIQKVDLKVHFNSNTLSSSISSNNLVKKDWEEIDAPLNTEIEWPLEIEKGNSVRLIFHVKDSNSYIDIVHEWTGITKSGKAVTYNLPLQIEPSLFEDGAIDIVRKARGENR